ncbi:hypothetical protein ACJJTC_013379 [Scirpophaga incertulas]
MFRNRFLNFIRAARLLRKKTTVTKSKTLRPITFGILTTVSCEDSAKTVDEWDINRLDHEFLIRQATTVNVNAATQLLTVTLVAIQDTSERLREMLSKEICLIRQALEWGDTGTPPDHWDQLVAVRGTLTDLKHNFNALLSYMDYAEKVATAAAEISYLSGNIAASDAICERIDHACRTCNTQKQLTHDLQQESLELQQQVIITSPDLEHKLKQPEDEKTPKQRKK